MLITSNLVLVYSIIIALIPINAKILLIEDIDSKEISNYENTSNENLSSEDEEYNEHAPHAYPEALLIQILLAVKDRHRNNRSKNSKCNRHFGSIFGAKFQKLLCLEKSKIVILKRSNKPSLLLDLFKHNNRDIDKFSESKDDSDGLSEDYIDFGDFGRKYYDSHSTHWHHNTEKPTKQATKNRRSLRVVPFLIKIQQESKKGKVKKPEIITEHSDTSESSEESDDTPKRFEVIENTNETSNTDNSEATSSETIKSSASNIEDSDDINGWTDENSKTVSQETDELKYKKKNFDKGKKGRGGVVENEKYGYMQGSDRRYWLKDLRKRLQYFLPKRLHWRKDDLTKLGYYWYDGPQGRYAGNWKENF